MANENFDKLKKLTEELVDRDFVLKRKQDMLENIVSCTPIPVVAWIVDRNLKFVTDVQGFLPINSNTAQYDSVHEYFGTIPVEDIMTVFENNTISYTHQVRERLLWSKCTPMRDYDGYIFGAMGITWDVTDIYQLNSLVDQIKEMPKLDKEIYTKIHRVKEVLQDLAMYDKKF